MQQAQEALVHFLIPDLAQVSLSYLEEEECFECTLNLSPHGEKVKEGKSIWEHMGKIVFSRGLAYVAARTAHQIRVFTKEGEFLRSWGPTHTKQSLGNWSLRGTLPYQDATCI